MQPTTSPPRFLWIGIAAALLLVAGLLLAFWPALSALSAVLTNAIDTYGPIIAVALLLAAGVALAGGVRAVLAWSWRIDASARQARMVQALPSGQLIDVADVHAAFERLASDGMRDHYAVELADRQRQFPLLTSFTNHQHNQYPPGQPPGAPTVTTLPTPQAPTFAQLLDGGKIGPGQPLLLGFDAATGQAIEGTWKDLYSCGVGALQGAGKSWLLAFLLCQSAAQGGRLIVCDLHAGDEESLATRIAALSPAFMCNVASTPAEIATALAFADDKLERRRTNNARWPIVLVCDEWTSLLRTSVGASLEPHIQNIAEQGRKYNVNALLAAQAWTKAASSNVRNQLTSHYIMRQRPDEARYQLGLRSEQLPDDLRQLPDATGYLLTVRGDLTKVVIPNMTAADIARVGAQIDSPASAAGRAFGFTLPATQPLTAEVGQQWAGSGPAVDAKVGATAAQTAPMRSPEAARAASLFLAGKSQAEIVYELRGVKSSAGGSTYKAALKEIEQLIREGIHP